jgi:hypothetical protein
LRHDTIVIGVDFVKVPRDSRHVACRVLAIDASVPVSVGTLPALLEAIVGIFAHLPGLLRILASPLLALFGRHRTELVFGALPLSRSHIAESFTARGALIRYLFQLIAAPVSVGSGRGQPAPEQKQD